jgi:hypothetical protein
VCAKVDIGRGEVRDAATSPNGSSSGAESCDAAVRIGREEAPAGFLRDFPAIDLDAFLVGCVFLRDLTGDSEFGK